ncbi:hypothetical protein GQ53DRAFT_55589 [Thozetella sp. PMI_491]|nr:hypothetical protein GQ53DRAFT_55589 [Thozetella sp. PMI_491]
MLHPSFAASSQSHSPPAARSLTPRSDLSRGSPAARRSLPDRAVASGTIEAAYVKFILYCNPGVPTDTSTVALREAFQTPPKSGGKTFSTFTLFELIGQLETKELKTWAELALKLGVDPPDTEKGESSQKIQQYAVRLKRWMRSMHVDAFFDYLLQRPSTYWTDLPAESNPINESERDGVAAEDDMALRSLMPQLKPRRGKRRGLEDDNTKSPMVDDLSARPENGGDPWSAQPDARGHTYFFPSSAITPSIAHPPGMPWTNTDIVQTPMTAYPHSAVTPSTRNAFWADPSEPKSAITPSKGRTMARRHGAKVVSSAWRSGASSTGKTRGRPPNRAAGGDGPFSAFPSTEPQGFKLPAPSFDSDVPPESALPQSAVTQVATTPLSAIPGSTSLTPVSAPTTPAVPPTRSMTLPSPTDHTIPPRPAKRSRLSLQVPERVGGEVRLATPPPPVVVINGENAPQPHIPAVSPSVPVQETSSLAPTMPDIVTNVIPLLSQTWNAQSSVPSSNSSVTPNSPHKPLRFQDTSNRTNRDELEAFFVHLLRDGRWSDSSGNQIPPCGMEEAMAIATTVIENVLKASPSKEAFLINMSALAGGKFLHVGKFIHITRYDDVDRTRYECTWELQLGDITGSFHMRETVPHDRWKRKPAESAAGEEGKAVDWEKKYNDLMSVVRSKDQELHLLRMNVLNSLRDPNKPDDPAV